MGIKNIAQDPRTLTKEVSVGYGYIMTGLILPGDRAIYITVDSVVDALQLEDHGECDVTAYGYSVIQGQGQSMAVISIDQLHKVMYNFC